MTPQQRDDLQRAAWQANAEQEETTRMDSDPYPLAEILYRAPGRHVPAVVWWFLAAAMFTAFIVF